VNTDPQISHELFKHIADQFLFPLSMSKCFFKHRGRVGAKLGI
jgi:hypothetical protein